MQTEAENLCTPNDINAIETLNFFPSVGIVYASLFYSAACLYHLNEVDPWQENCNIYAQRPWPRSRTICGIRRDGITHVWSVLLLNMLSEDTFYSFNANYWISRYTHYPDCARQIEVLVSNLCSNCSDLCRAWAEGLSLRHSVVIQEYSIKIISRSNTYHSTNLTVFARYVENIVAETLWKSLAFSPEYCEYEKISMAASGTNLNSERILQERSSEHICHFRSSKTRKYFIKSIIMRDVRSWSFRGAWNGHRNTPATVLVTAAYSTQL